MSAIIMSVVIADLVLFLCAGANIHQRGTSVNVESRGSVA